MQSEIARNKALEQRIAAAVAALNRACDEDEAINHNAHIAAALAALDGALTALQRAHDRLDDRNAADGCRTVCACYAALGPTMALTGCCMSRTAR